MERQSLVVVGNGMMGYRLCQRLAACRATLGPLCVTVFGEEPRPAYDRIRLTALLDGTPEEELCLAPASWYGDHGIELCLGDPVVAIDRDECVVRSASGRTAPFDRLVLATGSRPFVPPIPGTDLAGVFVYRTVDDLLALKEFAAGRSSAAVVGGGLLGLEAARAVQALGLEVHVVEGSPGLLPRQLDEAGGKVLRDAIESLGVHVHTGARTAAIEEAKDRRVVCLANGDRIEVDVVVLSAGIRPNGDLARAAGLEMGSTGGVVVDDHLQTSDPRVFAVGECATHRGVTYGLAVPGYRMIDVLVDNLVGGSASFLGSDRSARLKLLGVTVAALGRYEEAADTQAHTFSAGGAYRKLVLRDGRIVGALAVGEWPDLERVRDAIDEPRRFSFWDLRRFRSTGTLWLKTESAPVYEWPAEAIVCGCIGVRRGTLTEAEMAGCSTVEALSASTGAGTVCGSCRPLLQELLRRERVDSIPPGHLADRADSRRPSLLSEPPPSAKAPCSSRHGSASVPPAEPRVAIAPPDPSAHEPIEEPVTVRSFGRRRLPSLADGPLSLRQPLATRGGERGSEPGALLPPRREAPTLRSMPLGEWLSAAVATAAIQPPPVREEEPPPSHLRSESPPSSRKREALASHDDSAPPSRRDSMPPSRRDSIAPSSRRESMPPLRPISVPPGSLPALTSTRHPPRTLAPVSPPDSTRRGLLVTAAATLVFSAGLAVARPIAARASFRGVHADALWTTRTGKLVTGYGVVGLAVLGLALSLRKRWRRFTVGDVARFRVLHGALGAAALVCLACHTGLHLGERLNRLLSLDLLVASALGALASAATGLGDGLSGPSQRLFATRAHLFILLPLPVLLVLHVLGAYYF